MDTRELREQWESLNGAIIDVAYDGTGVLNRPNRGSVVIMSKEDCDEIVADHNQVLDALRAENKRLRNALREALNHWRMYAEQDPDFESTTDPTPESIEYRKCRAALLPKHCDLCDKMMESLEDRTQWHGLGNCVETCSHCNGSGVEPAPDQKGKL
jgi:hypothetical protein